MKIPPELQPKLAEAARDPRVLEGVAIGFELAAAVLRVRQAGLAVSCDELADCFEKHAVTLREIR